MRWWNTSWTISNPGRWCCESAALNMSANLETQQWPQDLKRSVFISKKGNTKECSNYHTIELISHVSKIMLKSFKPGVNSMWTMSFLMFKLVLEKVEEPEIKLPTSTGPSKKQEFQKNIYFCFIDYTKAFDCVDHNKLENSERGGHTRPPELPLEKSVCRSGSNS